MSTKEMLKESENTYALSNHILFGKLSISQQSQINACNSVMAKNMDVAIPPPSQTA